MLIKTIPVGQLETNCYVVTNEETLHCVVIDPGDESNTILDYLEDNHLVCEAILLTHGHYDHGGGILPFAEINPDAKIYVQASAFGEYYSIDSKGRLSVFDDSDGNPCFRFVLRCVIQRVLKSQAGDLPHLHLPVDHQPAENQGDTHNDGYQDYHDLFPALSCFFHFLTGPGLQIHDKTLRSSWSGTGSHHTSGASSDRFLKKSVPRTLPGNQHSGCVSGSGHP